MHPSNDDPVFWEGRLLTRPHCRSDLLFQVSRMRHPLQCPFYRVPIEFSFLHRLLMCVGGLFLSFMAIGKFMRLGMAPIDSILSLCVPLIPAMTLAHGLLLFLMPPTFVQRLITTLPLEAIPVRSAVRTKNPEHGTRSADLYVDL
jgi:hypothetical protein